MLLAKAIAHSDSIGQICLSAADAAAAAAARGSIQPPSHLQHAETFQSCKLIQYVS